MRCSSAVRFGVFAYCTALLVERLPTGCCRYKSARPVCPPDSALLLLLLCRLQARSEDF